ncbi:MAG: DUF4149 domain-containing protein [Pseudomonadota bacterium]
MTSFALLTASTLFGGMMLFSFGFAAFVFKAMPADQAGAVLREAFPWYYLFVVAFSALAAVVFTWVDPFSAALLALTAASAIYARQGLMPRINRARDAQLAGDAAAKRRFGRLHGASVVLKFIQLGAIGWALVRLI